MLPKSRRLPNTKGFPISRIEPAAINSDGVILEATSPNLTNVIFIVYFHENERWMATDGDRFWHIRPLGGRSKGHYIFYAKGYVHVDGNFPSIHQVKEAIVKLGE